MLSARQRQTIKIAQRAVGMPDDDYRLTIQAIGGWEDCTSCKDERLDQEHFDRLMKALEAGYWAGVDAGEIEHTPSARHPFRERGYWAGKNPRGGATSRDRFTERELRDDIEKLEIRMLKLGKPRSYCSAIRSKTGDSWSYRRALIRTIETLERKAAS